MTKPKTICCRQCNDSGIKGGENPILDAFEKMFGTKSDDSKPISNFCGCAAGAYRKALALGKVTA